MDTTTIRKVTMAAAIAVSAGAVFAGSESLWVNGHGTDEAQEKAKGEEISVDEIASIAYSTTDADGNVVEGTAPETYSGAGASYIEAIAAIAGGETAVSANAAAGVLSNKEYSKAQTLASVIFDVATTDIAGAVELKVGKKSAKGGVKVSGAATLMSGKKVTAKAVNLDVGSGSGTGKLTFKNLGDMELTLASDGTVYLEGDSMVALEAKQGVGGKLGATTMYASVEVGDFGVPDDYELLEDALPENVAVTVKNGTKWSTPAAPTIKYKRYSEDGDSWYELIGLDDEKKPNCSGLKLSYTAKTGAFKGSFKLYATNEGSVDEGKAPKLKKYTVNVNGIVVDGIGYGHATCKKPAAGPWQVYVLK